MGYQLNNDPDKLEEWSKTGMKFSVCEIQQMQGSKDKEE